MAKRSCALPYLHLPTQKNSSLRRPFCHARFQRLKKNHLFSLGGLTFISRSFISFYMYENKKSPRHLYLLKIKITRAFIPYFQKQFFLCSICFCRFILHIFRSLGYVLTRSICHAPPAGFLTVVRKGKYQDAGLLLRNDLESAALQKFPLLKLFSELFRETGGAPLMSGSGPTLFALYPDFTVRDRAFDDLQSELEKYNAALVKL